MKEKLFKKGITRRLFSVVLALAMVVALMPLNSILVYAYDDSDMCTCGHTYLMHALTGSCQNFDCGCKSFVSDAASHSITVTSVENGEVTASPNTAEPGTTITLTATPDTGYKLGSISGTYKSMMENVTNTGDTVEGTYFTLTATSRTSSGWALKKSKITVTAKGDGVQIEKIAFNVYSTGNSFNTGLLSANCEASFSLNGNTLTVTLTQPQPSVEISTSGTNNATCIDLNAADVYCTGITPFDKDLDIDPETLTFTMPDGNVTITPVFVATHNHTWSYSVENNTSLVATCICKEGDNGYADCDYKEIPVGGAGRKVSLTLSADNENYSGSPIAKATIFSEMAFTEFNAATGKTLSASDILIYAADDTSKETPLDTINAAGSYVAVLTVDGNDATLDFTVGRAPNAYTFEYANTVGWGFYPQLAEILKTNGVGGDTITIKNSLESGPAIAVKTSGGPDSDDSWNGSTRSCAPGSSTNLTIPTNYVVDKIQLNGLEFVCKLKPVHTHNFTYSVSGSTLTATCSADGCGLTDKKVSLTLTASDTNYSGIAGSSTPVTFTKVDGSGTLSSTNLGTATKWTYNETAYEVYNGFIPSTSGSSWNDAMGFVAALNTAKYDGHNDWTLLSSEDMAKEWKTSHSSVNRGDVKYLWSSVEKDGGYAYNLGCTHGNWRYTDKSTANSDYGFVVLRPASGSTGTPTNKIVTLGDETTRKAWTDAGLELPTVNYAKTGGESLGTTEPTTKGHYTASISAGNPAATATVDFDIIDKHAHSFTYSVNGAVLTATCGTSGDLIENCSLTNNKVELTLTASSANYSGSAVEASYDSTSKTAWEAAGLTAPAITYEAKEGSELTGGNAVNVGSYTAKASITVGANTYTATKDFAITAAPLTITGATVQDKTYDGNTNATVTGVSFKNGENVVSLTKDTDYTVTGDFDHADATGTNAATKATVTVTLSNSNYSLATNTFDVTKTIGKATPTYTAPTGLTSTVGKTLANVTLPTGFTWVEAGTTSVGSVGSNTFHVKFTPTDTNNYNVVESIEVTLAVSAKQTQTLTFAEASVTKTYGDAAFTAAATGAQTTVTYASSDTAVATVNETTGEVTIVGAGTATITATAAEDETYAEGTATYTLTVNKIKVTVPTAEANLVYNGNAQTGVVLPESAVYTLSDNTAANAGSHDATATLIDTANYEWDMTTPTSENQTITYTIAKKAITVTANNKSAYVGDTAPELGENDFTVTGLVGEDTLTTKPTLAYADTPDMTKTGTVAIVPSAANAGENYEISYTNGTLTISNRPSSGSSTPTVTVPVSGDEHSVNVSASVSGTTATVNIKDADIEKVTHADADTGVVEIDLSGLKQDVNTAKIPTATMDKIAGAIADSKNDTEGVSVKLSTATVTFDGAATTAIADQAKGNTIEIKVDEADKKTLTAEQKSSIEGLGSQIVIEATVISNGQKISDFKGGSAEVSIPYTLKNAQKANGLVVFFVADDGSVEKVPATYVDGNVVFTVKHFSHYVVAYNAANVFTDVAEGDYYYDAVKWAVENGITKGTSATTFSPDGLTTRAQVVTFLWRAAGCPTPKGNASKFTDIVAGEYYETAVAWAVENGITNGATATTFSPDAECTRAQVVTFLYRFNGVNTLNIKDNPFSDVPAGKFYYDAVLWAAENGITSGTTATTFSPVGSCTRGQSVTFLYRLLNK